jgi:hypothetical protein
MKLRKSDKDMWAGTPRTQSIELIRSSSFLLLSLNKWMIPSVTSTDGMPEKYGMLSGNSFNGMSSEVADDAIIM